MLLILSLITLRNCQTRNRVHQEYIATLDSIRQVPVIVQGDTSYRAETRVIQASIRELSKLAEQLKYKDSTIAKLRSMVNSNTKNATYYNSVTNITNTTDTIIQVTNKTDTFYTATLFDKWYKADLVLGNDTARLTLAINNPFQVSQEYTRKGLRKELTVKVLPLNPYTRVTELKSFTLPKKKHYFRLGPELQVSTLGASVGVFSEYQYKDIGIGANINLSPTGLNYGGTIRYYFIQF